jgi:hypothetical protein
VGEIVDPGLQKSHDCRDLAPKEFIIKGVLVSLSYHRATDVKNSPSLSKLYLIVASSSK